MGGSPSSTMLGTAEALLLLLLAAGCSGAADHAPQELLIGWRGESYVPAAGQQQQLLPDGVRAPAATQLWLQPAADAAPHTARWVEAISDQPRAFVYHNFLTHAEADHLISLAAPHLQASKVVQGASGAVASNEARTSSGAWIKRGQNAVVRDVEARIAEWTRAPVENGEPLHVLRYLPGQQYAPHVDYFLEETSLANGGQRVATVLLYLSDVEIGGETVFPLSTSLNTPEETAELSDCGKQGLAVCARKGDALLFFSSLPDGSGMDQASIHGGCPVIKGIKYVASKWLRAEEWIDAPLHEVPRVLEQRRQQAAAAAAAATAKFAASQPQHAVV